MGGLVVAVVAQEPLGLTPELQQCRPERGRILTLVHPPSMNRIPTQVVNGKSFVGSQAILHPAFLMSCLTSERAFER